MWDSKNESIFEGLHLGFKKLFFQKKFQGTIFVSHLTMDAAGLKLLDSYLIRICRNNYLQQTQGVETNYCKFVTS